MDRVIALGATEEFKFTSRDPQNNNTPATLAGTPTVDVYEDASLTQAQTGVSVTADFDTVTGLNHYTLTCSAANGYEAGKAYFVVISAGTVNTVSAVGEVVKEFRMETAAEAAIREANEALFLADTPTAFTGNSTTAINLTGIVDSSALADHLINEILLVKYEGGTYDGLALLAVITDYATNQLATVELIGTEGALPEAVASGDKVIRTGYHATVSNIIANEDGAGLTEAGGTGDHLTAQPWNAAWDAEVQSEAADALVAYDPPTKAELDVLGTAALATQASVDTIDTNVDTLLTRITSTLFSGITSLAEWLGAIAGKQAPDATAQTELRATGAASGTYDATTDSQEAIRDRGDAAWAGTGATAGEIADAVWDEATSGHATAGTFGKALSDILTDTDATIPGLINALNDPSAATIADAIWDEAQADHVTAGTFGEIATEIASILADTNELQTDNVPGLIAALNDVSTADVNAQLVDVLNTDTQTLPGQGAPTATPTLTVALMYLYKAFRNKSDQTSTLYQLYADDGTTVDQKRTIADDGTTFDAEEIVSGP